MEDKEKLIWFVPLELREPNIDFSKFQKYNKNYKLCKGVYLLKFGNEYYIGKTNDKQGFQQRFRKHKMYIKKYFNDIEEMKSFDNVFNSHKWDGHHGYSKMTKALIDNNLTVDDIEYYLLDWQNELYDNDELLDLEEKYIKKYNAYIYGINQIGIVSFYFQILKGKQTQSNLSYIKTKYIKLEQLLFKYLVYVEEKNIYNYKWIQFNINNALGFYEGLFHIGIEKGIDFSKISKYKIFLSNWVFYISYLKAVKMTFNTENFKLISIKMETEKTMNNLKLKNKHIKYNSKIKKFIILGTLLIQLIAVLILIIFLLARKPHTSF